MLWNKSLLKWEEPDFARKFIAKHLKIQDYLYAFGKFALKLFIGSYIVFWIIGWLSPQRNSNPILSIELLAISAFIVGSYFLIWLMTLLGSKVSKPQIRLGEKDIRYISVDGSLSIPYKKLESFSIIKANLEENEYFVLQLKDWDGNESFIEIDPKISNETIIEILRSKNILMKQTLANA